mmetsp:Transcript_9029/g.18759  ORF Transcript_9029/g.18759 Transcript_9029/m.18759 type:complete len:90 (-) Transcript_9029:114-383(-)
MATVFTSRPESRLLSSKVVFLLQNREAIEMVKSNNPNTAQRNPVAAFTMNSLDLRGDDPEGDFDVGESRGDDDDDNMTAVGVIADFFSR